MSGLRRASRKRTGDPDIDRNFDAIGQSLDAINSKPAVDHQILPGVDLHIDIVNRVPHKLGRRLIGWSIVRKRANADIFDQQDANKSPDLTLDLVTSVDATVDLMVF